MTEIVANEDIALSRDTRGIVTLFLQRPERGNALTQSMLNTLAAQLDSLAADNDSRVIVLRSAGKHFCTGVDMGPRAERSPLDVSLAQMLDKLDHLPKPVIALVQGGCVGGGLALAACADAVIAHDDAFFAVPELRLGMAPSAELAALFMRAIGAQALRRYGLTGERFDAGAAQRFGLVHDIASAVDIGATLARVSDAYLLGAPLALAHFKAVIGLADKDTRTTFLASAGQAAIGFDRHGEAGEGVAAFREKRKPAWYRP